MLDENLVNLFKQNEGLDPKDSLWEMMKTMKRTMSKVVVLLKEAKETEDQSRQETKSLWNNWKKSWGNINVTSRGSVQQYGLNIVQGVSRLILRLALRNWLRSLTKTPLTHTSPSTPRTWHPSQMILRWICFAALVPMSIRKPCTSIASMGLRAVLIRWKIHKFPYTNSQSSKLSTRNGSFTPYAEE